MTPTFPPIDPATISSLRAGDERTLERIFRSHYDALHSNAVELLPDEPASAPRVVASAVRELWNERGRMNTSAEVERFLLGEIAKRAQAVRARMGAVHRFEKTEGLKPGTAHAPPDADQMWAEIAAALHAPAVDPAKVARQRHEQARHGAAGHIASVTAPRAWKGPLALGLIAALGAVALFMWMNQSSREQVVERQLAAAEVNAVTTMPGQLGSLSLTDGSAARLGAESRLVTVPDFGDRYRSLRLAGTASFTVSPSGEVPFEVRIGNATIAATTGVLSVRDYDDEEHAVVRIDGGEAEVTTGQAERTVAAGESVVIGRDGSLRDATAEEAAEAFAWADGRLVLNDATATEAAAQLRRWYGMEVEIVDAAAGDRRLSLDVPLESSQAAIDAIEEGARLRFGYRERQMVFEDAGAPRG